jgi:hypothetical protein
MMYSYNCIAIHVTLNTEVTTFSAFCGKRTFIYRQFSVHLAGSTQCTYFQSFVLLSFSILLINLLAIFYQGDQNKGERLTGHVACVDVKKSHSAAGCMTSFQKVTQPVLSDKPGTRFSFAPQYICSNQ